MQGCVEFQRQLAHISPSLWGSSPVPGNAAGRRGAGTEESCLSPGTVLTSLTPPDGSDSGAKQWGRCQHPWERHTFFLCQKQAGRRSRLGGGRGGRAGMALKRCWEICPHLSGLWGCFKERNKPASQDGNSVTASAKSLD